MAEFDGFYMEDWRGRFKNSEDFFIPGNKVNHVINCLAAKIAKYYETEGIDKKITMVEILRGGGFYTNKLGILLYYYGIDARYSYLRVGRYKGSMNPSKKITIYSSERELEEIKQDVKDFPTLLVDEIVQDGITLEGCCNLLEGYGAILKATCLFLRPNACFGSYTLDLIPASSSQGGIYKPRYLPSDHSKETEIKRIINWTGFLIDDEPFLYGGGMDEKDGFGRFSEDIKPVRSL